MCKKDTPHLQIASMIKGKPNRTSNRSRKTRSKRKKPKFLSLRANLSPATTQQSGEMSPKSASSSHRRQQLNLFPLHPENSEEEKDMHEENVSCFFEAADGGATELNTLLGGGSSSEEGNTVVSPSVDYGFLGEECSEEVELERTAMRRKGRDGGEEKWVCYSEVVERKEEEVTSCVAGVGCEVRSRRGLSLKLDYEEIMSAWSDKGPLYVRTDDGDSPQTVPDLRDHDRFYDEVSNGLQDCWGNSSNNGGLWTVPEGSISSSTGILKVKEEVTYQGGVVGGEEWNKMCQREASVLRYKEKRQNRLFSKRIRYEVRKVNAEKRPRMKGRFVKRS